MKSEYFVLFPNDIYCSSQGLAAIALQRWSYWREHLKYVWNVYCDLLSKLLLPELRSFRIYWIIKLILNICHRTRYRNNNPGHSMPFKVIGNAEKSPGRSLIESWLDYRNVEHPRKNDWYPGKSIWVLVCVCVCVCGRGGGGRGLAGSVKRRETYLLEETMNLRFLLFTRIFHVKHRLLHLSLCSFYLLGTSVNFSGKFRHLLTTLWSSVSKGW